MARVSPSEDVQTKLAGDDQLGGSLLDARCAHPDSAFLPGGESIGELYEFWRSVSVPVAVLPHDAQENLAEVVPECVGSSDGHQELVPQGPGLWGRAGDRTRVVQEYARPDSGSIDPYGPMFDSEQ